MNDVLESQLIRLSAVEKLELIGKLWDSLSEDELPPPTPEQLAEVQRRLEEHRRNPDAAIPYEEFLKRMQSRFK